MNDKMLIVTISFCLSCLTIASCEKFVLTSDMDDSALEKVMRVDPINVAAVGRVAKLGELYDARTDQFFRMSLVNGNLSSLIQTTHSRHSNLKYLRSNTLTEKLENLNVQAGFKLSVIFGLFEVSGSAKFFKDKQHSSRSAKMSVANFMTTEFEQIDIAGVDGRKLIDLDILEKVDATHVVVGIQWGGNVIVSVEDTNYEEKDKQMIDGNLSGKLEMVVAAISIDGSVHISDEEKKELSQFNFELYGDIVPTETPTTLVDSIILMKSVPRLIMEANDGKGKALSYTMLPITLFRELLSIETNINSLVKFIDESTINACVKLFEDIRNDELRVNDLMIDLKDFQDYIAKDKIDKITRFSNDYQLYQNELRKTLSQHLILVRSGDQKINKLIKALDEAYNHQLSPNNIDFDQFVSIRTEFKFLKYLSNLSVYMLDKDTSFQEYMLKNYDKDIYAFFYTTDFPDLSEDAMITFRHILETRGTTDVFVAIKVDVLRDIERQAYFNFVGRTRLRLYKNGKCMIEDYKISGNEIPSDVPELWSLNYMQTLLAQLLNRTRDLENNAVPIGFVYVQLANQTEPSVIWPNSTWTQISKDYAGLFFRAEGGAADLFGSVQADSTRQITKVQNTWTTYSQGFPNPIDIPSTGYSVYGHVGHYSSNSQYSEGLRFYTPDVEVRPRNMAIRIWKKTA